MTPRFFDVHTHVNDKQYDADCDEVIRRALNAGIKMVQVGTDFESSQKAVELAESYDNVYATVGLHPNDVIKEEFNYEKFRNLVLSSKKVVAIGECGLDYFRVKGLGDRDRQKEIFKKQIELAKEVGKPLMIHCREAFTDLVEILSLSGGRSSSVGGSGIVHFFSGSINDAEKLLDLGFYFSFGGVITFARDYDQQIKFIPLDRILLETDAPYVAPVPYRGKRNEPLYIIEVAKKIAEIKRATIEKVALATSQNALQIFAISKM
ncbi:MAG: TatD family hydrolase, partial [Patescibacteria group bacterium]